MDMAMPRPFSPAPNYLYSATHNPQKSISMASLDHPPRTPSPTISEYNALNGIKEERSSKQKILLYVGGALVIGVVAAVSLLHDQIINALSPAIDWLRDHKFGPAIPIIILVVMSFPPLFGHELIEILCGVTWDPAPACAIVAAGVLLGELANFIVFKTACTARSKKLEKSKLSFALLAHIVREGGFLVVLVIRYSAIPPHFATSIFSTVGLSFLAFAAACVLSLPKAFVPVYIGWASRPENEDNTTSGRVEKIVLAISVLITLFALRWIRGKMEAAKPDVIYLRRKARQWKLADDRERSGGHISGV